MEIWKSEKSETVNDAEYQVIRLLGKGKGGYSYLVTDGNVQYVLKQIHHEPCEYYTFGNKLEAELRDYDTLRKVGIPMPRLLEVDSVRERILKEYIAGQTVFDLICNDRMENIWLEQVQNMCQLLYPSGLNIDYFPTNFVLQNGGLYYIDYECNEYMPEWDFEHWGIKYWSKTAEFLQYCNDRKRIKLIALPCICADVFDGTDIVRPGGEALNFAAHASKFDDILVTLLGIVGNDMYAEKIMASIAGMRINTKYIRTDAGHATAHNRTYLTPNGDRYYKEDSWDGRILEGIVLTDTETGLLLSAGFGTEKGIWLSAGSGF